MTKSPENEWHEFRTGKDIEMPPGPHKKLKLLADANIPQVLIDELRAAGLVVDSVVEMGISGHPDDNIVQLAKRLHKVILTMDRDFWDDNKHPLRKSPGIIFVDVAPAQVEKAIDGLARFYGIFAREWPLDWWHQMKARVTEHGFAIRSPTWDGNISEDEFQLTNGKLLTRKIR